MKRFPPQMVLGSLAFGLACTAGVKEAANGGNGGSGSGGKGGGTPPPPTCNGPCTDFPASPLSEGAPAGAAGIFGDAGSGSSGGPCLLEPQIGALFPANWLRPRFRVSPGAGQNLFEIRLHAENQANDLVVYTTNTTWTMPRDMWAGLSAHSRSLPITIGVRGASQSGGGVAKGTSGAITIAPVGAGGNIVYWSTSGVTYGNPNPTDTLLSGFTVGDEAVVEVLKPGQAMETAKGLDLNPLPADKHCIGCHTSTPDGAFIAFNDFFPWNVILASGKPGTRGAPAVDIMMVGGYNATTQPWLGISTFSKGHWAAGDHVMVAGLGTVAPDGANDVDQQSQLAWFDLESSASGKQPAQLKGQAFDFITAAGGRQAAAPAWSHDGSFIVYTSLTNSPAAAPRGAVVSGRLGSAASADLYEVPYGRTGQAPGTPVPGASDPAFAEYYPAISADDRLIAFNRIPQDDASRSHAAIGSTGDSSWDGMYAQPLTEVYVVSRGGGTTLRLDANLPPECAGVMRSPGINNSWPKWSPEVSSAGGKLYYWLIFSSWRDGLRAPNGSPIAQLYVAGVVQDEVGIHSFPAIYLWNQPTDISNHTPAWDVFQIPTVQ